MQRTSLPHMEPRKPHGKAEENDAGLEGNVDESPIASYTMKS